VEFTAHEIPYSTNAFCAIFNKKEQVTSQLFGNTQDDQSTAYQCLLYKRLIFTRLPHNPHCSLRDLAFPHLAQRDPRFRHTGLPTFQQPSATLIPCRRYIQSILTASRYIPPYIQQIMAMEMQQLGSRGRSIYPLRGLIQDAGNSSAFGYLEFPQRSRASPTCVALFNTPQRVHRDIQRSLQQHLYLYLYVLPCHESKTNH
jgi:hypothetical protein